MQGRVLPLEVRREDDLAGFRVDGPGGSNPDPTNLLERKIGLVHRIPDTPSDALHHGLKTPRGLGAQFDGLEQPELGGKYPSQDLGPPQIHPDDDFLFDGFGHAFPKAIRLATPALEQGKHGNILPCRGAVSGST